MKQKETLQTVKNYADSKGWSTTWVYKLIERGDLTCKEIDGIKFVVVK